MDRAVAQFAANLFGHGQAVHDRHVHVADDQLDARVGFQLGQTVAAIHRQGDIQPVLSQEITDLIADGARIIHHQDFGPKVKDGFGNDTKMQTLLRAQYLFNIGDKSGLMAGVAYEYWRNKFGNDHALDPTGGSIASTPMLVAEYHF